MNLNTPIWQLTVGEFLELQKQNMPIPEKNSNTEIRKSFVYGIAGLAELLQCSKATAQTIKSSGVIDKATSQIGRKIVFDADLTIELINKSRTKRK